jgi:hypothetical protein
MSVLLSVVKLNVTLPSVIVKYPSAQSHNADYYHFADCLYFSSLYDDFSHDECHYAECRYAECHFTEYHFTECHFTECQFT